MIAPEPTQLPFIEELSVFLVCAAVIVPLARRLGISPVLGFLIVGVAVGPFGLGRLVPEGSAWGRLVIRDVETTRVVAEFGVVFLLFVIGLELSPQRLWAMRRLVFGLGGAQVAVTGAAIAAIVWAAGMPAAGAVPLGACLALSSTAIVMQLLAEQGRIGTQTGRTAFAVLLLQDLAVIPILFLVAVMASDGGGSLLADLALALAKAALAVALIALVGRVILRPAFRLVSGAHGGDPFMAMALFVIVATSLVTHAAGLSLALGAFLAGLLLAETEFRHAVSVTIEPFKGLLLGLFFMSVGMTIDIATLPAQAAKIAALVGGLVALKVALGFVLARLFRVEPGPAAETALLLGSPGEFAFVVVAAALAKSLLPAALGPPILAVISIGMLLTPGLAWLGRRVDARLTHGHAAAAVADAAIPALEGHVIIAGYGRVGGLLREVLDAQNLPYIAVERDPAVVAAARRRGLEIHVGDAARLELLERLGLDRAAAVVVTMDDMPAIERIVTAVRARWPALPIISRARDQAHGARLLALGATTVVPEALEAALELAEVSLCAGGVADDAARQLIDRRRDEILATMKRP